MIIKIGKVSYEFTQLTAKDYFRLKDLNSNATGADIAIAQLISKGVKKEGEPIEVHEVSLIDGRVIEKYVNFLNKGGSAVEPKDGLPIEDSEAFTLGEYALSYNPDYVTGDYTKFLAQTNKQPGTALCNLIRARILLNDQRMTQPQVEGFSYSDAIALEKYLSQVFTDTPDQEIS